MHVFGGLRSERWWPLGLAIVVTALLAIAMITATYAATGTFLYPLDDPFIHMVVAKNFAATGVPGINPGVFANATSSYLWPFLLYLGFVAGIEVVWICVAWSGLFALAVLFLMDRILVGADICAPIRALALVVFALTSTLPVQIFSAMEHTLHATLVMIILIYTGRTLGVQGGDEAKGSAPKMWVLAGLLALGYLARPETLFVACPIALVLLWRRGVFTAAWVLAISLLPMVLIGGLSIAHGGQYLPNSVLLKGHALIEFSELGSAQAWGAGAWALWRKISDAWVLSGLWVANLICALIFYRRIIRSRRRPLSALSAAQMRAFYWCGCFLIASAGHLFAASVGWLYRYEFYLICVGSISLLLLLDRLIGLDDAQALWARFWRTEDAAQRVVRLSMIVLSIGVLGARAYKTSDTTVRFAERRFLEQYQYTKFLNRYYPDAVVALNDIGLVSYEGRFEVVDLFGLGDNEVTQARLSHTHGKQIFRSLAAQRGIDIVVIFDSWFQGDIPTDWIKVGAWGQGSDVYMGEVVVFYARTPESARELLQNLREFSALVPAKVQFESLLEIPR